VWAGNIFLRNRQTGQKLRKTSPAPTGFIASPSFGLAAGNRQVLANIFIIGIVSAELEMIVQKAKSFLQDVSVIDYSRAA
jgi:hypothetical protein